MGRQSVETAIERLKSAANAGEADSLHVELLGQLIDAAGDIKDEALLEQCIAATELLHEHCGEEHGSWLHYCHGNAWGSLYLLRHTDDNMWWWKQPELVKQIFHYRSAILHPNYAELTWSDRAQMHCNLANAYKKVGRVLDGFEHWRVALDFDPRLAMASGNMGDAFFFYARSVYEPQHQMWLAFKGWECLRHAVSIGVHGATHVSAANRFAMILRECEKMFAHNDVHEPPSLEWMKDYSMGEDEREQRYREWCLDRRLFLNPMNDAYEQPVASHDSLSLPTHRGDVAGITYLAFFNQLKQEFVYARWSLFEGTFSDQLHVADRETVLASNADQSRYSIQIEQVKTAFRASYSLLDKVAYFINDYMPVGLPEKQVDFSSIWNENKKPNVGQVRNVFEQSENIWLHALHQLSKDIYDETTSQVASPDAQALKDLRNHLEHKFVKVVWCVGLSSPGAGMHHDNLAREITLDDLAAKAERLLQMARSALIYLCLAMHRAEEQRAQDGPSIHFAVDVLSDDLKG